MLMLLGADRTPHIVVLIASAPGSRVREERREASTSSAAPSSAVFTIRRARRMFSAGSAKSFSVREKHIPLKIQDTTINGNRQQN
jgi:hypothetical protein